MPSTHSAPARGIGRWCWRWWRGRHCTLHCLGGAEGDREVVLMVVGQGGPRIVEALAHDTPRTGEALTMD